MLSWLPRMDSNHDKVIQHHVVPRCVCRAGQLVLGMARTLKTVKDLHAILTAKIAGVFGPLLP
jgi:hypothetical protein